MKYQITHRWIGFAPVGIAISLLFSAAVTEISGATVYMDGEFADVNWTTATIHQAAGVISSEGQQLSGGNPGAYRQFSTSFSGQDYSANFQIHLYSSVYNPAVQGALASVVFDTDAASFAGRDGPGGNQFDYGFALEQEGSYYGVVRAGLTPTNGIWYPVQSISATDSALARIAGSGPLHPDFSPSGAPIRFGYYTDFVFYGTNTGLRVGGIDNWSVTITTVPEPSSVVFFVLGAFVWRIQMRRRESQ